MDSFEDQNFGHILGDLTTPIGSKASLNLPVPLQGVVDEIDMPDRKILTPLEIPKSKSQLNFCKSLTEKLKSDDTPEFPLTDIEPIELMKNLYSESKDDCYLIPNSTIPTIFTEIPKETQESNKFIDHAREEILACLSDMTPPSSDSFSSISYSEIAASLSTENSEQSVDIFEEEDKVTRPRFCQQKHKSSNVANSTKRKTDDASICSRPAKQRAMKSEPCLYYPGMIVWAKITGYSYWPAMIDHDPDVDAYFWSNDSTNNYTHYHVVFFDTNGRLSRSWVKTHYLKLFTEVIKISNSRPRDYIERFKRSVKEAKEAMNLSLEERLKKYSFKERLKLPGTILCQD